MYYIKYDTFLFLSYKPWGDVVAIDCTDSILMGHDKRVLAAVGLRNIVVVDTEDALLVAPRDRVQEVRAIVESLRHREGKII